MEQVDDFATRVRIGFFIFGALLFSPVLLPVALISLSLRERRLQAALRRTACVTCGNLLTERALEPFQPPGPEDPKQTGYMSSISRHRMLSRPYVAICVFCGQAYDWNSELNQLKPISAESVAAFKDPSRASRATALDSASEVKTPARSATRRMSPARTDSR